MWIFYVSIIVFVIILSIIIKLTASSKNKKSIQAFDSSNTDIGNLSVIFDEELNVTAIPFANDLFGKGRASEEPQHLEYPYTDEQLGALIKRTMKLCNSGKIIASEELMKHLGTPDWKKYSYKKKNISVSCTEKDGIIITPSMRKPDGSYVFHLRNKDIVLSRSVDIKELGQNIIKQIQNSKA